MDNETTLGKRRRLNQSRLKFDFDDLVTRAQAQFPYQYSVVT